MRETTKTVAALSVLALMLLLAASLTAILLDDGGDPYPFTTPRGEQVEIYGGAGPYQFDNTYKAIAFRSFDWANLVVVLPLFVAGLWLYRRGKFRGQLLLAALFTYSERLGGGHEDHLLPAFLLPLEQTGNLSLVTRQGAGLLLSKWDINQRSLSRALERLLSDASLRENMLRLKALQDKVDGPANAAREIVSFLGASKSRMEQIK